MTHEKRERIRQTILYTAKYRNQSVEIDPDLAFIKISKYVSVQWTSETSLPQLIVAANNCHKTGEIETLISDIHLGKLIVEFLISERKVPALSH